MISFMEKMPRLLSPLTIEPGTAMLIGGGLGAGGSILGGMFGSSAAKQQAAAMREAIAEQRRQYNETVGRMKPYYEFGTGQLNALGGWLDDPNKSPMSYLDPGYEFRRQQGLAGVTGNAATAGLIQSGDTLRALEQYGQGLASSEYGNAFNRWLGEGTFRQGLAGMGQSAAANLGYIGANTAANIGNFMGRAGEAEAESARTWGNVAAGIGGMGGNMLARYLAMQHPGTPPTGPSGSAAYGDPFAVADWNNPAVWRGMGYLGVPGGSDIFDANFGYDVG